MIYLWGLDLKIGSHGLCSGAVWTGVSVNVVIDFNEVDYSGRARVRAYRSVNSPLL